MFRALGLAALLACGTVLVACSDDDEGTGPETDLSGNYTLVSFQQDPNPAVGPPIATGALVLTSTTYNVTININVPGLPAQTITDNGTYTISGNQITQTSAVQPIQSTGTWSLSNNVLTTDLTAAGTHVLSTWQKQ
jgi:hypothetical protein